MTVEPMASLILSLTISEFLTPNLLQELRKIIYKGFTSNNMASCSYKTREGRRPMQPT